MAQELDRENITEWFHEFASLELNELAAHASKENREKFTQYIACNIPDFSAQVHDLTSEQFAKSVLDFRENERTWNQAVCAVILSSDDLFQEGLAAQAVLDLQQFAESCPWILFKEVALNQASHYR